MKILLKQKLEYFFGLIDQEYLFYYNGNFYWKYCKTKGNWREMCEYKLGGSFETDGYRSIRGVLFGYRFRVSEHHLVYAYFYGVDKLVNGINKGLEINHDDGIKYHNHPSNLELVTRLYNNQHAYDTGLKIPMKGENHPMSKLTDIKVLTIKHLLDQGVVHQEIADMFNVTVGNINKISNGKLWHHLSYCNSKT